MVNYKAGTSVYFIEEGLLYPISAISNTNLTANLSVFHPFIDQSNIPEFLKRGENILDKTEWQELISVRDRYVDTKKGSLKIKIHDGDIINNFKIENLIEFQTINTDILAVENYEYDFETYNLLVFDGYNAEKTNLTFMEGQTNDIFKMRYDRYVREILNGAMSILINEKDIREKYDLNIVDIEPELIVSELDKIRKKKRREGDRNILTPFVIYPSHLTMKHYYKGINE